MFATVRVPPCVALLAVVAYLAATGPAWGEEPRKVALLAGVNDYDRPGFSTLKYAEKDVDALGAELKRFGFEVAVLKGSGKGADRATRANILKRLDALLEPLGKNDMALVALSGHGEQFDAKGEDGKRKNDAFYCPVDAVHNDPQKLVSLSHLIDEALAPRVGYKIVLVDACRNDPDAGRGAKGVQGKSIALPENTAVFFSCTAGQQSYEQAELGHGLFTYCLLDGLRSGAAGGQLTWSRLQDHVLDKMATDEVSRFVPEGRKQEPIPSSNLGRLVLAKLTPVKPVPPKPFIPMPVPPKANDAKTITSKTTGMTLVLIPAGEYTRGSPDSDTDASSDEKPPHQVKITQAFYLGRHEVTQGEWQAVMGIEPWKGKTSVKEGKDYPATYVSWDDAQEFCKKLSEMDGKTYRLPTEAEWEYAARGGTTTRFSFGDDEAKLGEYAWYGGLGGDGNAKNEQYAHVVGLKKPNPFGLFDMHGNVYEWCQDWYDEKEYAKHAGKTVSDPQGPSGQASNRVLRGGSWSGDGRGCRSANRGRFEPEDRGDDLGFRLAAVR